MPTAKLAKLESTRSFLASIAFIIIGLERMVVGIKSRLISIGIGVGIVIYFGSGYFLPEFVSKLYVLILGSGLLATGALRITDGIRNNIYESSSKIFTLGIGGIRVTAALFVLMHPVIGFILLLLIVSLIFFINGVQIAFVGITGKKLAKTPF